MSGRSEAATITSCLSRVRRRLFLTRLLERSAMGLAAGAAAAIFFVAGRLAIDWSHWIALEIALLPAFGGAWLWHVARKSVGIVGTKNFLRLLAVLAWAAVIIAVALLSAPGTMHAPAWMFAAGTTAMFVLAAAMTVRPVEPRAAAIFIDQQVGLRERLSTALELLNSPPRSEIEAAFHAPVLASALNACQSLRTARVRYARADERLYAAAATVAIAAAAVCLLTPLPAAANQANKPYLAVVDK